ncbi:uncharacterized protein LOC34623182 [Cyclospora cayetanensis]|uniref:Uncharacterized protein LOC34623182 n=1 Tax=Cyclospora cayetanensis TaxID=88456 RepID=A0A6P6RYV0_9EIME|nr:uncharacterized protein LOC34623182 [Cyclospora cayetanensis]
MRLAAPATRVNAHCSGLASSGACALCNCMQPQTFKIRTSVYLSSRATAALAHLALPRVCRGISFFGVRCSSTRRWTGTALGAFRSSWMLTKGSSVRLFGLEGQAPGASSRVGLHRWNGGGRQFATGVSGHEKDFYRLLGVSPADSPRAIRTAYLRKAKELHPDANQHCPRRQQKERLFREVTQAYEVLSDPLKKKEPPADAWHVGQDEVGEEFWRQVEQIRREKEMAWRAMKVQKWGPGSRAPGGETAYHFSPAFAFLRALPLLVVPAVLFFVLYKLAMSRARQADRLQPPIVRDELGRAFFIDSSGRRFRVMEFDFLTPASSSRDSRQQS